MDKRIKVMIAVSSVLISLVLGCCIFLQTYKQSSYLSRAVSFVTDTVTSPAIRGRIVDCDGKNLVSNKLCLSLEVGAGVSKEDYNRLIALLDVESDKYPIGEGFVIRDVSTAVASAVLEAGFDNVHIIKDYKREYTSSSKLSHVVGYTGMISAEEYEVLAGEGYGTTDTIGKSGIEKTMEKELKGADGKQVLKSGKKVFERKAVEGCIVRLTVNKALQDMVESKLYELTKKVEDDTGYVSGGAAVVIDVNSGGILAMASAPDYNPDGISKNYTELISNEANPLLNRCISGCYEPGSTFKPLVALAALNEGVIGEDEIINDLGVYKYYAPTYMPACHIWNQLGRTHGEIDVVGALAESCNYFFYETGRRLGINRLKQYAEQFGFGEKCGIEIDGELSGTLASPEVKEWFDGDTLQASIGQSVNMFTPLQLACYAAALANGGKLYRPYVISDVTSPDGRIFRKTEPFLKRSSAIPEKYFDIVRRGMRECVLSGTASSVFEAYDFTCAGKTGTAQVPNGPENGIFIGFVPYDKPEIAVAVVIEHGSGEYPSKLSAEIMEKYLRLYD